MWRFLARGHLSEFISELLQRRALVLLLWGRGSRRGGGAWCGRGVAFVGCGGTGRSHTARDGVQKRGRIIGGERGDAVADAAQEVIEPAFDLGFREIVQNVGRDKFLPPRMADAKAHAVIFGTDMRVDRPQAVVTGMAAACFDAAFAGSEVQLIMKDGDVLRLQLVKAHGFADRLAGKVHKGFGLQQEHLFGAKTPFADLAVELVAPRRKTVVIGNAINGHEADVMAVAGVFPARISEADKKFHAGNLAAESGADQ